MGESRDVKRHALALMVSVSGPILHKWEAMGSENSMLGYPVRAALVLKPLDGKIGLSDAQLEEMISLLDAGVPAGVGQDHSLNTVSYRKDVDSLEGAAFCSKTAMA